MKIMVIGAVNSDSVISVITRLQRDGYEVIFNEASTKQLTIEDDIQIKEIFEISNSRQGIMPDVRSYQLNRNCRNQYEKWGRRRGQRKRYWERRVIGSNIQQSLG